VVVGVYHLTNISSIIDFTPCVTLQLGIEEREMSDLGDEMATLSSCCSALESIKDEETLCRILEYLTDKYAWEAGRRSLLSQLRYLYLSDESIEPSRMEKMREDHRKNSIVEALK